MRITRAPYKYNNKIYWSFSFTYQGRNMNAIKAIKEMYSVEDFKEIANHGCQSGVCRQHIYYGDTNRFFETYEEDIFDHIVCNYGMEFLVEMFKKADADLTTYKNAVCWAFIEMVAMEAEHEYQEEYDAIPSSVITLSYA